MHNCIPILNNNVNSQLKIECINNDITNIFILDLNTNNRYCNNISYINKDISNDLLYKININSKLLKLLQVETYYNCYTYKFLNMDHKNGSVSSVFDIYLENNKFIVKSDNQFSTVFYKLKKERIYKL
jgi:hypothetical protein